MARYFELFLSLFTAIQFFSYLEQQEPFPLGKTPVMLMNKT